MNLKALTIALSAAMLPVAATAQEIEISYKPEFSATVRAFARQSTADGSTRFQIANARAQVSGAVMPWMDYFLQADLCDNGKMKILDVFATFKPCSDVCIMLGQSRVPFSVEATRAPWAYYFADVALCTLYGSQRSVGIKAGYHLGKSGVYAEGGIFNSAEMTDHNYWGKRLTYGIKVNWKAPAGLTPEIGFQSRVPGGQASGVRINMVNTSLSWRMGHLFIEGEYVHRSYAGASYGASQGWDIFADYYFNLRSRTVDRLSVQARFDGITAGASGTRDSDGRLVTDIPARRRITLGVTASKKVGHLYAAFRINYEQYLYGDKSPRPISTSDNNQLIAGIIVKY